MHVIVDQHSEMMEFTVCSLRLTGADDAGGSYYLKLTLGHQVHDTSIVKAAGKEDANATWNESFSFHVSVHTMLFGVMQLDLYK